MPKTFEVETTDKIYTVQANSEEEARAAVNSQLGNPTDITGEQQASGDQPGSTPTGLAKFGQVVSDAMTTPVPGGVPILPGISIGNGQSPSQILTTPARGLRGVGVGVQQLAEGANPADALNRASAAVQPGYVPQPGEKIGSAVGETIGSAPLAAALTPEFGAASVPALARYAVQALAAGAGGGAFAAINDASEKGRIEPSDVVVAGGINAIFPLVRFIPKFINDFMRASTEIPIAGTTSLSREALRQYSADPKILEKAAKSAEEINNQVEGMQRSMANYMASVGEKLKKARIKFNIMSPIETPIEQQAKEGIASKSFEEINKEFIDLKNGYRTVKPEGVNLSSPIKQEKNVPIPIKERIAGLYDLRYHIDQNNVITGGPDKVIKKIGDQTPEEMALAARRFDVNKILDDLVKKVPGATDLRETDKAYSMASSIHSEFLKKLSNPEKAQQVLMGIFKKGDPDKIVGVGSDAVKVIRRLEKETGQKFLEPLRKEYAAREFSNLQGRGGSTALSLFGLPGAMMEAAGPTGLAHTLDFMNSTSDAIKRIGDIALSRGSQALATGATSTLKENK